MMSEPPAPLAHEWFLTCEGKLYCPLCETTADEKHVCSESHQRKIRAWGQRRFFKIWTESTLYCLLCYREAKLDHIFSDKHQYRIKHPQDYGFPDVPETNPAGSTQAPVGFVLPPPNQAGSTQAPVGFVLPPPPGPPVCSGCNAPYPPGVTVCSQCGLQITCPYADKSAKFAET